MSVSKKIVKFLVIAATTFGGSCLCGFYDWTFLLAMVIIPSSFIYIAVQEEGIETRKKIDELIARLDEREEHNKETNGKQLDH